MIHPITLTINATFTACLVPEGGMKRKQTSTTTFSNNKSQKHPQWKYGNLENPCCRIFFDKNSPLYVEIFSVNFYKKHTINQHFTAPLIIKYTPKATNISILRKNLYIVV